MADEPTIGVTRRRTGTWHVVVRPRPAGAGAFDQPCDSQPDAVAYAIALSKRFGWPLGFRAAISE